MLGREIPIRKGVATKIDGRPSQVYFDIDIAESLPAQFCIRFQNFYTASVLVTQLLGGAFKPIVRPLRLMENPYLETESQDWFVIQSSEFQSTFRKDQSIRLFLLQPASVWTTYELRSLQVFEVVPADTSNEKLPVDQFLLSGSLLKATSSDWQAVAQQAAAQASMKIPTYSVHSSEYGKRSARRKDKDRKRRQSTSMMETALGGPV